MLQRESIDLVGGINCNDFQLQPLLSLYVLSVVMMPPEVATTSWRSVFEKPHVKKNLVLLAIDEVHCICEWLVNRIPLYIMYLEIQTHYHVFFCRGPTFRTAFQKLGGLRAITKAPIMALTASAPPAFEREIVNSLALDNTVVVREQLNRPNIYISVGKKLSITVSLLGRMVFILDDNSLPFIFRETCLH